MRPRGRPKGSVKRLSPARTRSLIAALLHIQRRVLRKLLIRPATTAPTRAQSIFALADSRELIATTLLTIPSAGVMLLTYRGTSMLMAEHGAGLVQKGEALTFAVTIGVLVFLGWYFLFGVLHHLRGRRLAGALTAGGAYVLTVACIDAPFNMLALGGGSAVQMSLVDTTAFYEGARKSSSSRTNAVGRLIPGFRAQAVRFRALEASEIKGGSHSDKKGPGKVSAGFGQIAALLTGVSDQLEAGLGRADAIQGEITALLSRMKKQAYQEGSIRARAEAVSAEADRIDDLLGRLAQFDTAVSIKATLASLENLFPAPKAAASRFEAVQNDQLATIAIMAQSAAKSLQAALDTLPRASAAQIESVRPADPMTAIRTYWRPLLPQWVAALFVDLAPALLLFILIAARREAEQAEVSTKTEGVTA